MCMFFSLDVFFQTIRFFLLCSENSILLTKTHNVLTLDFSGSVQFAFFHRTFSRDCYVTLAMHACMRTFKIPRFRCKLALLGSLSR